MMNRLADKFRRWLTDKIMPLDGSPDTQEHSVPPPQKTSAPKDTQRHSVSHPKRKVNPKEMPVYKCSFCGKTDKQVERLIAGDEVHICNNCVKVCAEILGYEIKKIESESSKNPTPPCCDIKP